MYKINHTAATKVTTTPDSNNTAQHVYTTGAFQYVRVFDTVDYVFAGIIILIVIIGIIGFIKSVRSRKYYKCPVCKESFRSENMHPETCKICGADLEETNDTNVTDKTK